MSSRNGAGVQEGYDHAGESDQLYLYLRGKVHRPRYIAGVVVGSYSEAAFKESTKDVNSDMLKTMGMMADEVAYQSALATCSEVVPQNLSAGEGGWWATAADEYGTAKDEYGTTTGYLGITRTDDPAKALRGFALLEEGVVKTGAAAAGTITVGGNTKYELPKESSSFVFGKADARDEEKRAFLYTSRNSASLPGCPMTDLYVSAQAFEKGKSTVIFADKTGEEGKLLGKRMYNYIHLVREKGKGTYMNSLYVAQGHSLDEALLNLLAKGATEAVVADINMDKYNPIVIGYRTIGFDDEQMALHERMKGTLSDPTREVIRDVVATVDEPLRDTLIHNGVVYKPVSTMNINRHGFYAPSIYLYQCMDHYTIAYNRSVSGGKKLVVPSLMSKFQSPITSIGVAFGDRVPYNADADQWAGNERGDLEVWENLLSTRGDRVDLKYGVVSGGKTRIASFPAADTVKDNRCYLFFHREDNAVKPGAEIVGGTLFDVVMRGEVYGFGE